MAVPLCRTTPQPGGVGSCGKEGLPDGGTTGRRVRWDVLAFFGLDNGVHYRLAFIASDSAANRDIGQRHLQVYLALVRHFGEGQVESPELGQSFQMGKPVVRHVVEGQVESSEVLQPLQVYQPRVGDLGLPEV